MSQAIKAKERRDKAIEKAIQKAQQQAEKRAKTTSTSDCPTEVPRAPINPEQPQSVEGQATPNWSLDHPAPQGLLPPPPPEGEPMFETLSEGRPHHSPEGHSARPGGPASTFNPLQKAFTL